MREAYFMQPQTTQPLRNSPLYVVLTDDGTGPFGHQLDEAGFGRGDWLSAPTAPTRMDPQTGFRVTTEPWDLWAFEDMRVYEVAIKGRAFWFELDKAWYVESVRLVRPVANPDWFQGAHQFVAVDIPNLTVLHPSRLGTVRSERYNSDISWLHAITRARGSAKGDDRVLTCTYLGRCAYNIRASFPYGIRQTAHTLFSYRARQEMERLLLGAEFLGAPKRRISENMITAAGAMAALLVYDEIASHELRPEFDTIRACWATILSGYALVGVSKSGVPLVAAGPGQDDGS